MKKEIRNLFVLGILLFSYATKAQIITSSPNIGLPSLTKKAAKLKAADQAIGTDASGRTIYQGPRGGQYVLNASGKKEKLKTASSTGPQNTINSNTSSTPTPIFGSAKSQTNTTNADASVGTDAMGRTIYQGPRGGKYVLNANGKKERVSAKSTTAPAEASNTSSPTNVSTTSMPTSTKPSNTNTTDRSVGTDASGRTIYQGPRGGQYVLSATGKKERVKASATSNTGTTPNVVAPTQNTTSIPTTTKNTAPLPNAQVPVQGQNKGTDQAISTDSKGRTIYQGPRGGKYYLTASGRKEYLRKTN